MTRMNEIREDKSKCGHAKRTSYGLPCAHELPKFKREDAHIPLNDIDNFLKILDDIPLEELGEDALGINPIINMFSEEFEKFTNEQKHFMALQLMELPKPGSTRLKPPSEEAITKGRPIGSVKKMSTPNSSKRDPSGF
ncbi:hypothetical protein FRX31_027768 [Thalictrum thalictroides]|uniref:Uncharacterized protein n=1 Tax=Thalictrum thalictroides TaxID=46969 RepID=A0A7J6VEK6_THATH|nr:hypothetical protein FRX31_027768 [Thalictrum thalictroides]